MINLLRKHKIPDPPYHYDFLLDLDEKEYPVYLEKIFANSTGEKLNLKHPKTFNQKIQWLKLYDCSPLKTRLTDKVLVRDWVKEQIGEEYLKPVLWIGSSYDEIPFDELPDSFFIIANNGCKWYVKVKDKNLFLRNELLIRLIKSRFDGWMGQSFFPFAGFELQYKNIEPKILIEPLLLENVDEVPMEIEVYCFNGVPRIIQKIRYSNPRIVSVFDENYNVLNLKFKPDYVIVDAPVDDNLRLAVTLSDKMSKAFKLVRVDWLLYKEKIFFNEMTFTPFSGFYDFADSKWNTILGDMLKLE